MQNNILRRVDALLSSIQANSGEDWSSLIRRNKLRAFVASLHFDEKSFGDGLSNRVSRRDEVLDHVQNMVQVADATIGYAVIKGASFEKCIYGSDLSRDVGDIDILVSAENALAMHETLIRLGYVQRFGPTSVQGGDAKAILAVAASRKETVSTDLGRPIKRHKNGDQFVPYVRGGYPTIELHDALRNLPDEFLEKVINDAYRSERGVVASPLLNFILLIATVYDNSESFYSNTFDYGVILRDYVDLAFFFERYSEELDWGEALDAVEECRLSWRFGVVLSNLEELLGRDTVPRALDGVRRKRSILHAPALARLINREVARNAALEGFRKELGKRSFISIPIVPEEVARLSAIREEAGFRIVGADRGLVVEWVLPSKWLSNDVMCQAAFFPLEGGNETPLSYKLSLMDFEGEVRAYWRCSNRLFPGGALAKRAGASLRAHLERRGDLFALKVPLNLDASNWLIEASKSRQVVVVPDVCTHKHSNVFWSVGSDVAEVFAGVKLGQGALLVNRGVALYVLLRACRIRIDFGDASLAKSFLTIFPKATTYCCLGKRVASLLKIQKNEESLYVISKDGKDIACVNNVENAFRILVQLVMDVSIIHTGRGLITVHAGAVARGDKALMIMGTSGSGKTSLSIALSENLRFMNDECVFLDARAATVRCDELPFLVKERNGDVLSLLKEASYIEIEGGAHGAGRYYANFCANAANDATSIKKVTAIVFPEYKPGAKVILCKMPYSRLVENVAGSLSGSSPQSKLLAMFLAMVSKNKIPVRYLQYGNVVEAAKMLERFLGSNHVL